MEDNSFELYSWDWILIISIGVYLLILKGLELSRYSMIAGWAVSFTVAIGIQIITAK